MSTPASALDLNDPRLTQDIQNVYIPGPPKSRFAKHYLKLAGDEKRAARLDRCGSFRDRRDVNNHTKREARYCMDAWCKGCSVRLSRDRFEHWESTIKLIENGLRFSETITFVEARIPHSERSKESASDAFKSLDSNTYRLVIQEPGLEISPRWENTPGYEGNDFILRVLSLGDDFSPSHWASLFPVNATVKVVHHPVCRVRRIFREKLLAVNLSDDPIDRAEQSALLGGMHRFRAHGISTGVAEDEPEEIFVMSEFLTNISPEQLQTLETVLQPSDKIPRHTCTICGEKFTQVTQWFNRDAPEPRESDKRWYDNPPPS